MSRYIFFTVILAILTTSAKSTTETLVLNWSKNIHVQDSISFLVLQNGTVDYGRDLLPVFSHLIAVSSNAKSATVIIKSFKSTPLTAEERDAMSHCNYITNQPELTSIIVQSRSKRFLSVEIPGIITQNGTLHKINAVTIDWQISATSNVVPKKRVTSFSRSTAASMPSGSLHKFAVLKTGPQILRYEDLIDAKVINGPISSNTLGLYGAEGGMVPYKIGATTNPTTSQLAIEVSDGGDGTFEPGDYLLFYGEAGSKFYYDQDDQRVLFNNNLYCDSNYVFLSTSEGSPKRIATLNNTGLSSVAQINTRTAAFHHEAETTNLLSSGRKWLGEEFHQVNPISFELETNHISSEDIWITISTSTGSQTLLNNSYQLIVNNDTIGQFLVPKVSGASYSSKLVEKQHSELFKTPSKSLKIELLYNQTDPTAIAFLDYLSLNFETQSTTKDSAIIIRNKSTILNPDNYEFVVKGVSDETLVWSTDIFNEVKSITCQIDGDSLFYKANTQSNQEFAVFQPTQAHTPVFLKSVTHENLSYLPANLIIITPPLFEAQAKEIANFHEIQDEISTIVGRTDYIYNNFSSGRKEAGAIRNYIKSLYDQSFGADSVKYVLLLGTGSYDPKNRLSNNIDLVPVYESANSVRETESYVTDDFYGVMDEGEGEFVVGDFLDLAVGRIPSTTAEETAVAVKKIKQYYSVYSENQANGEPYNNHGSWRNHVVFIADDGDNNDHANQADQLAEIIDTQLQEINVTKIYSDQYLLTEIPGGKRYPDGNKAVIDNFNKGALIVNYTGHGGGFGWSGERILDFNSIYQLKNKTKLPLIMTATCEFSRFDDPDRLSAGEILLFRKDAGAIALFTTVRVVYSIPNFNLNRKLFQILGELKTDEHITMGELFMETKIRNNVIINDRNFTLLGDPALKLMIPNKSTQIDSITSWNQARVDTIHALTQGEIHGHFKWGNGQTDTLFNGSIEVKIFDQKVPRKTLNNRNDGAYSYLTQESLLFKGNATVEKGKYTCPFIIPKDAVSTFGTAKISTYAVDQYANDAAGFSNAFTIGGTDTLAPTDRTGPEIAIYLNDSTFSFGDIVAPDPYLLASFKDESGINLIPGNFEHNIILTLNDDRSSQEILNDHYQSDENNYKKGALTIQLEDLNEGKHSLKVGASDNYNNSSEAYTEFIIEENAELALEHVLNYPNPFTTNTSFYFEQNQRSGYLDVQIQIFTISGRIIKTIVTSVDGSNERIGPINWNGRDDFGDPIGRGVYLYKLSAKTSDGEAVSEMEKLVILR